MKFVKIATGPIFAVLFLVTAPSSAQVAIFDENTIPTNPVNGFGTFTFDDFGATGAVTDGATSIILDVVDSGGGNGVFGGLGVDFVVEDPPASGTFVPQDFDPAGHFWELSLKLLPDNAATAIRLTMGDDDGGGAADEHVYEFDLTGVPNDGQFHTLTADLNSPLFSQTLFGFTAGNGTVDPGLRQIQFQSVFGSTGRLNVEVDFAQIVPEPASAALLLAGGTLMLRRRVG